MMFTQTKNIIVSVDDVYDGNDNWYFLQLVKKLIPEFKITLFVIAKDTPEYWETL